MSKQEPVKGPLGLRLLVWVGSAILAVLLIWAIGFVLKDAGRFRQISWPEVEKEIVGRENLDRLESLKNQIDELKAQLTARRERRDFLRQNVQSLQDTLRRMLEIQQQSPSDETGMSDREKGILSQVQEAFLANQSEFERELDLQNEFEQVQRDRRQLELQVEGKRKEAQEEYRRRQEKRNLQAAGIKVAFLLPLILVAAWLFLRKRGSAFDPIIYAFSFAVLWELFVIIHEHFPKEYFKYIFVGAAILVVLRVLFSVIRLMTRPGASWLLKRYREAYRKGNCAVCGYPIVPEGLPLTHEGHFQQRHKKAPIPPAPSTGQPQQPYVCPSCGTNLFEHCGSCEQMRHTLLPNCLHCGAEKEIPSP
ncbi:hypothetical protein HQ520_09290 [bacterium]|nr:hypothetical protein [bacterium]